MGDYKGIPIPDKLSGLIEYMSSLDESRESLSVLAQQWDLLAILGKMSETGTDMSGTREGFNNLTSQLLGTLGIETLKKSVLSINSKAQVTVDIVIRNLFERTADIGFLAIDDDIRRFLISGDNAPSEESIKNRFAEYVAKYSVYNNIILLDTDGNVKCQLSDDNPITRSEDSLIQESIVTTEDYIETYRWTDLNQKDDNSLVYSYRVCETNDPNSKVLGVLCLVFKFQNEMEGVFANLISENDWTVLTLLDANGKVIASSDQSQVAVNLDMDLALDDEFKVIRFGGRLYLAKTCPTHGYQGYIGLGWYGHAMLPIQFAFERSEVNTLEKYDHKMIDAVTRNPRLFSEDLRSIPKSAQTIQSELDRTVWNGNMVMSDSNGGDSKSSARKVLLSEISTTGSKTKNVFEDSINDLHGTVVTSILSDAAFVSYLAIDIMDRNLYERANDCRWWALTTAFREILSKPSVSQDDAKAITEILQHINELYTVYTNLIVFDKHGKIIAVSNVSENELVGSSLSEDFVRHTLMLPSTQHYSVSPFDQSHLYGGEHTYIYGAAIRNSHNSKAVVGGIGIVFDSTPEFKAMLEDALPHDSHGMITEGCFAVFSDRDKNIISSSSSKYKVGEKLNLDSSYFSHACGEGVSEIIEFEGQYYALGVRTSKGYREYKSKDSVYQNDVVSLAFILLGDANHESLTKTGRTQNKLNIPHKVKNPSATYKELASFYIGDNWFGIEAEKVVEAINVDSITPVPGYSGGLEGTVLYGDAPIGVIKPHNALGIPYSQETEKILIVVMKTKNSHVGVIVDELGEISEVEEDKIHRDQGLTQEENSYVDAIVKPREDNSDMLILLDPTRFMKMIIEKTDGENRDVLDQINTLGKSPSLSNSHGNYDEENTLGVLSGLKGG